MARALNNLAEVYRRQARYAEAEPLFKRSLAIREKALGIEHPDVVAALNNLARLYCDQDDYAAAEPLFKRVLAIGEKALGADNPNVATLLENITALDEKTGGKGKARKLKARAAKIRAHSH